MSTLGWTRASYGLVLIAWPNAVGGLLTRGDIGPAGRTVVRVLGVREAGQALVCAPRPSAAVLRLSAGVDLVHAATMFAFALRPTRWRRPALVSAAAAAGFAVVGVSDAAQLPRRTGEHLRLAEGAQSSPLDRAIDLRDRLARRMLSR